MRDPRDFTIPQLVLAGLVIAVFAGGIFAATTSASAFGAFNYDWDGTADLRSTADNAGTDSAVLQNMSAYDRLDGNGTLVMILGPNEPYTDAEIARVDAYVRRGGTLLVSGDFGSAANDLLAGVNASVRVDGGLVRDERNYGKSPSLPVATNVSSAAFGSDVAELALNYPSALTGTDAPNVSVLAMTSEYAYIDENRNDELDDTESLRAYPVVSREPVGSGSVIAVSDPSLFINSMLDRRDNRAFAQALFASADRVRFDYTHTGGVPPLVQILLFIRSSQLVQFGFGTLLVAGLVVGVRYGPSLVGRIRSRRQTSVSDIELSEDEFISVIANNHPDWDNDRVRRIASQLVARRETSADGND